MSRYLKYTAAATTAIAVSSLLWFGAGTANASPSPGTPAAAPASGYTWGWSDGNYGTRRTFTQARYGSAENLPYLMVDSNCDDGARIGDTIKLQWRTPSGRYAIEDEREVTSCKGTYRLEFYPYADDDKWARGTYQYRLIIPGGGGFKYFEITYRKR